MPHVCLAVTLTARFGRPVLDAVQATDVAAALPRSQACIPLHFFEISLVGQATTANDDSMWKIQYSARAPVYVARTSVKLAFVRVRKVWGA